MEFKMLLAKSISFYSLVGYLAWLSLLLSYSSVIMGENLLNKFKGLKFCDWKFWFAKFVMVLSEELFQPSYSTGLSGLGSIIVMIGYCGIISGL